MEALSPQIARLFSARAARRRELAALSFPEKVRIVVEIQRMAAPVLRARGRDVPVWELHELEANSHSSG